MKIIALALICITSSLAHAGGKLSFQPTYFFSTQKLAPVAGFSVYEKLVGKLYLNSYTGIGEAPIYDKADVTWVTSKNDLDLYLTGGFMVSGGYQWSHSFPANESNNNVHMKFTVKLW